MEETAENVSEDMGLASCVRAAFDEGVAPDAVRLGELKRLAARMAQARRVRRRLFAWGAPLLAASLAAAVAFWTVVFGGGERPQAVPDMTATIGLLCELDGVDSVDFSVASAGEILLAWQEEPCADLL